MSDTWSPTAESTGGKSPDVNAAGVTLESVLELSEGGITLGRDGDAAVADEKLLLIWVVVETESNRDYRLNDLEYQFSPGDGMKRKSVVEHRCTKFRVNERTGIRVIARATATEEGRRSEL